MNYSLLLSKADTKIKLLRLFEYFCLMAEDYLIPAHDKNVSSDMLHAYSKLNNGRKLLRILFSLFNLRKILEYRKKDKSKWQRLLYITSKGTGIIYYFCETLRGFLDTSNSLPELSSQIRKVQLRVWTAGLLLSNVYCLTYLVHSYGKEAHLKDVSISQLKPLEIICIMSNLAEERHLLVHHIICNVLDLFIGCHLTGFIEKVFKTRVTNGVYGVVGIVCTTLRIFLQLRKRPKKRDQQSHQSELQSYFYGYD